jgi:hypothetical protein
MRRILPASACVAVVIMGPVAMAQSVDIVIEVETVAHSSGVLTTEAVPSELMGATCQVTATAENQSSVHPDSNLIITSGSDSITLLDVERAPGAVTTASETLTLSSEITVSLEIGPDGIFSGGITVVAACDSAPSPSPSPTTTETPSPTPSEAPTESPSPSPTEPSATVTHTTTPSDTPPPTVEPSGVTPVSSTATPPGGLAFTGSGHWQLLALASAALLVVGLWLLRAGYKRRGAL